MRRFAMLILATLAALAGSALAAQPTPASGGERVNSIIVYGEDPCPVSAGDEITVCARKVEAERFRIPAPLRETPSARSEAWNERVMAYETVSRMGTHSCSPIGPGGSLGCTQRLIDAAYAEKRGATDVNFTKMIEDERAKRAAATDAVAAATQARVEQVEQAIEARQHAASDAAAAAAQASVPTKP